MGQSFLCIALLFASPILTKQATVEVTATGFQKSPHPQSHKRTNLGDHPLLGKTLRDEDVSALVSLCQVSFRHVTLAKKPQFIYLMQGSVPRWLAAGVSRGVDSHLLMLSFRNRKRHALFYPNSTWPQGLNALYGAACLQELRQGWAFAYYIKLDDDTLFVQPPTPSFICPQDGRQWDIPAHGVVRNARGIRAFLREFEQRLVVWEPALASPGKLDGMKGNSPIATYGVPHHFYAIHREAAQHLLPLSTGSRGIGEDMSAPISHTKCWREAEFVLQYKAIWRYRGHIMLMGTGFEAIDPRSGTYPDECVTSLAFFTVYNRSRMTWPAEEQQCLIPRPEHTGLLEHLTSLCAQAVTDWRIRDTVGDRVVEFCIHLEMYGLDDFFEPICLPWGSPKRKGRRSYARALPQKHHATDIADIACTAPIYDDRYSAWLTSLVSTRPLFGG